MSKGVGEIRCSEDLIGCDPHFIRNSQIFELSCRAVINPAAGSRIMVTRLPHTPNGDHESISIDEVKAGVQDLFGELRVVIEALAEV